MNCDTCEVKKCTKHSDFLNFHAIWSMKSDIDDHTVDDQIPNENDRD